nr:hypothetical protein [Tanacetum cinerariifolium]
GGRRPPRSRNGGLAARSGHAGIGHSAHVAVSGPTARPARQPAAARGNGKPGLRPLLQRRGGAVLRP